MKYQLVVVLVFLFTYNALCQDVVQAIKMEKVDIESTLIDHEGIEDLKMMFSKIPDHVTHLGLGEATHGTKEFWTVKSRIIKYLIQEEDYKSIGFEVSYPEMMLVNNYIQYGEGKLDTILANGMYWWFKSKELLVLFEWLIEYNRDQPQGKKIKVFGFDPQNPHLSKHVFYEYYDQLSRKSQITYDSLFMNVWAYDKITNKNALNNLKQELILLNDRDSAEIEACFKVIYQADLVRAPGYGEKRDYTMAHNAVAFSEGKTILWAHNTHLANRDLPLQQKFMGKTLNELLGSKFYGISFQFNYGEYVGNPSCKIQFDKMSPAHFSGHELSKAGKLYFCDLNSNQTIKQYFSKKRNYRDYGAACYKSNNKKKFKYRLSSEFDGMIYIEKTSGITLMNLKSN